MAWDPIKQEEVWRISHKADWNGGVLATASNVVFQGNGEANFVAYDATSGQVLWQAFLGRGIIAPPVTYLVDGTQYVTIVAGWGGIGGLYHGLPPGEAGTYDQIGRVFTFALGGNAPMPEYASLPPIVAPSYQISVTDGQLAEGSRLYSQNCSKCHGGDVISGMGVPDLRRASDEVHAQFEQIVYGAPLDKGMPTFGGILSREEIQYVQAYVLSEAQKAAVAGSE